MAKVSSNILEWRKFVPEATAYCYKQFGYILSESGFEESIAEDLFFRACQRYCGYLKLIHHKVTKYFTSIWGLHGVARQFSIKEAKWLLSIMKSRTTTTPELLTLDNMQELLLWCAYRYNFWLAQQLYRD
jgi:hypothetical protein